MAYRQTCSVNGGEIAYLEWGTSPQPPVLLLHGLADHAGVWSALGSVLGTHFHVIAPDMRGHGDSAKPDTGYRAIDVIADLEALMDYLGWGNAHVLGHSWTGKVACIWVSRAPQRFLSMILVDPIFVYGLPSIFRMTFPLFYRMLPFLKGMGPFESLELAISQAKTLKQYRGWSELQEQVFRDSIEPKANGCWGGKFTLAARNGIFEDVLTAPGLTHPVETPTLFLQPEQGVNRFSWQLKPYRKYLSNLSVQKIPGNHWAFLVESAAFNQAVVRFLQAAPSPVY